MPSRSWVKPGHSSIQLYGGSGAVRCQTFIGSWGDVATFSNTNPDGNRGLTYTSRNAAGWHAYECIVNRNGQPQDTTYCELMKLEGTNNSISDSVLRNSDHNAFNIESGAWSWHARGGRVSHCVIENLKGPVASMRDNLDDLDGEGNSLGGSSRLNDYQFRNCILRSIATDPRPGYENEVLRVVGSTGVNLLNVAEMHGITIEDATRDETELYVNFARGTNNFGKITLAAAMSSYPDNFSDITVVTDAGLDDAPSASVNILAEEMADYYTLNPSDVASLGQGVALTNANGSGSSSTSLVVDDSWWFEDPQDGIPPFGQIATAGGFYVYIAGVGNVRYTAIDYTTHTLTLASAASWSDNAAIHKRISSGSSPNRGYMR